MLKPKLIAAVQSETIPVYKVERLTPAISDNETINKALSILYNRMKRPGKELTSPADTKAFLQLKISDNPAEVFGCLFMDNRHRVIKFTELFQGTIDGASVYPREVIRACIECNAAAVILSHNHPSGIVDPSEADKRITKRLQDALALIDVRVLDHVIVSQVDAYSFAEMGII